jgi:hypothetical protein
MDNRDYGSEDARGFWKPNKLIRYADVFVWPPQFIAILKWLPGYVAPWGLFYGCLAVFVWTFLTPSMTRMEVLAIWLAFLLRRVTLDLTARSPDPSGPFICSISRTIFTTVCPK